MFIGNNTIVPRQQSDYNRTHYNRFLLHICILVKSTSIFSWYGHEWLKYRRIGNYSIYMYSHSICICLLLGSVNVLKTCNSCFFPIFWMTILIFIQRIWKLNQIWYIQYISSLYSMNSVVFDASAVNVIVVGEHAVAAIVPGMEIYSSWYYSKLQKLLW